MKTPDRYTKFREKVPQKAGTYTYTMSMWEPPPPPRSLYANNHCKHKYSCFKAQFGQKVDCVSFGKTLNSRSVLRETSWTEVQ